MKRDNFRDDIEVRKRLKPFFGTCWWLKEEIIKETIPGYHSRDRSEHPQISLMKKHFPLGRGYVPFLYGSSKGRSWHFIIENFQGKRKNDGKKTYFGSFRPRVRSFLILCPRGTGDGTQPLNKFALRPNWRKRKLNSKEEDGLKDWLNQR